MPTKKQFVMPTGIHKVIEEKEFQNNRPWFFFPQMGETGKLIAKVGDEWLSDSEFNGRFPINYPVNLYGGKKRNPDTTKDYLY